MYCAEGRQPTLLWQPGEKQYGRGFVRELIGGKEEPLKIQPKYWMMLGEVARLRFRNTTSLCSSLPAQEGYRLPPTKQGDRFSSLGPGPREAHPSCAAR